MMQKRVAVVSFYDSLKEAIQLALGDSCNLSVYKNLDNALESQNLQSFDLFILEADEPTVIFESLERLKNKAPDLEILIWSTHFVWEDQEKILRRWTGIHFQEKKLDSKEFQDRVELILEGSDEPHTYILRIPT